MKQQVNYRIKKWGVMLLRFVSTVSMLLLMLLTSAVLLMQLPAVQTYLAQKASNYLSELIHHPIQVGGLYFNWIDQLVLRDIVVKDANYLNMIEVHELEADFKFKTVFRNDSLYFDDIRLNGAHVRLVQDSTLNINQFIDAIANLGSGDTTSSGGHTVILFDEVVLLKSSFGYEAKGEPPLPGQFDYNNFVLTQISGKVSDFKIADDTIEMNIAKLTALYPPTNLRLNELNTFFRYTMRQMQFYGLDAKVGNSILRDTLVFKYKRSGEFADFNDKITIQANLKQSVITTKDLGQFAPALQTIDDVYYISGDFKGKVSDFRIKNLDLRFGNNTHLKGRMAFDGLPNIDETFIDLELDSSYVNVLDIEPYIPDLHYATLEKFGNIYMQEADYKGFIYDFATKGSFFTDLGYLKPDINLKLADNSYSGYLKTVNFDLGRLTDQPEFQLIDMEGNIEGNGLSMAKANFALDAAIQRLGLFAYDYRNIRTDGTFTKSLFNGELSVDDPNLQLSIKGEINMADSSFFFDAQIDTAFLDRLKLFDEPLFLSFGVHAELAGLDPSNINGRLILVNNHVNYKGKTLNLDLLTLITHKRKRTQNRTLSIDSELFEFDLSGNYDFDHLLDDGLYMAEEFWVSLANDSTYLAQFKAKNKPQLEHPYVMQVNFEGHNLNPVIGLFTDDFRMSRNALLKANFNIGTTTDGFISFTADSVAYQQYVAYYDTLLVSIVKHPEPMLFDTEVLIASARQNLAGFDTENFRLTAFRYGHSFNFDSEIAHQETRDRARLKGHLDFYADRYEVNLTSTKFTFMEEMWQNAGLNRAVYYKSGDIQFKDMKFATADQESFRFDGLVSTDTAKHLAVNLQNINLRLFGQYLDTDLDGRVFADADISGVYDKIHLNSSILVKGLQLNQYLVGDFDAHTQWNDNQRQLDIDAHINRKGDEIITVGGYYAPFAKSSKQLNMNVFFNYASLKMFESLVIDNVSDLNGNIIGQLGIAGSLTAPRISGEARIFEGRMKINYLGTTYTFSDRVRFREDSVFLKRFTLIDDRGEKMRLDGFVTFPDLHNIRYNIRGEMNKFKALNTTEKDNDLFYGTAIGTGSIHVFGTLDNSNLEITAQSEQGTKIYLPLTSGYEESVEEDYIQFVSKTRSQTDTLQKETAPDLSGLNMLFNLDVTPDAYCEVIFDKKAGDIIRGNGRGKLRMAIDTRGDFTMYGGIEIENGTYNFTLLNAVNKAFKVKKGSRIDWSGDPYGGTMDVTAVYVQQASLAPIIEADSAVLNSPEVRRRYPVEVSLNMQGGFFAPDIKFGIDMNNYPNTINAGGLPFSLYTQVEAFKQRIRNDEQELNRQVFSLIVLQRLSAANAFSGISQSVGSSVSELLSNQLSYWVSQVDSKLEIDLNLGGLNSAALNTFQMRLSYTLLDGRLRITREGAFTNVQNQTNTSSVIGDWTIEYILSDDGNWRAKMYHKQNVNSFTTGLENNSTAGVSIMQTTSFDNVKEIFERKRTKKAQKRQRKQQQYQESAPTFEGEILQ